jgi:RNA polymerase sigma factor, sigma-70 family
MDFSENSLLILQEALNGDTQAWELLFSQLWPIVNGVVVSITKNNVYSTTVEDISQNVFVLLTKDNAKRLRQYNPDRGILENYVARIAHNCAIDYLRSNAKHLRNVDLSSFPDPITESDSVLPMLEEWEMIAALATLTARERQVIDLVFKQNLETSTAAKAMNVSRETVRSEKSHALQKLRKFFGVK